MSIEAGFIQALREDPHDDETRLIYADWLDERGDPRGEFLRVQVELANGVPDLEHRERLHQRSAELLAAYEAQWLGPLRSLCEAVWWRRGQPHLVMTAATLLRSSVARQAATLFERALVAEVRVVDTPPNIRDNLVASRVYEYLPHLALDGLGLGDAHFHGLLNNPHFRGLRSLSLAGNDLGPGSVRRLLASPVIETLVEIDLRNNRLNSGSYWALTTHEGADRLRDLRLHCNPLDAAARDALTAWRSIRLARRPGRKRLLNSLGMELVWIGPGTYRRGSPPEEVGRYDDEGPRQVVTVSRGFYLAAFQVTQTEYERVTGQNPARHNGPHHPVEMVSWQEANDFCARLSAMPEEAALGRRYRLPTEAEWEWAARCGWDHTALPEGREVTPWLANFGGSIGHPLPVGSFPPTPWGLYDQSGNLWDWCADWYAEYPSASPDPLIDPTGPETGSQRSLRGGSWYGPARNGRCSCRGSDSPLTHDHFYGFRVLLEIFLEGERGASAP